MKSIDFYSVNNKCCERSFASCRLHSWSCYLSNECLKFHNICIRILLIKLRPQLCNFCFFIHGSYLSMLSSVKISVPPTPYTNSILSLTPYSSYSGTLPSGLSPPFTNTISSLGNPASV